MSSIVINLYRNLITKEGFSFFAQNLPRNSWLTNLSLNADEYFFLKVFNNFFQAIKTTKNLFLNFLKIWEN